MGETSVSYDREGMLGARNIPAAFTDGDAADGVRREDEPADGGPLEDAARRERDYVRERLRRETGREPSEEEVSDWLRRHTEGY